MSGSGFYALTKTVMEVGTARRLCAFVTHTPPGQQQAPNPAYFCKWNVERPYRSLGDSRLQSLPMAVRKKDVGKSECHVVMAWIQVLLLPDTKVGPRPTGGASRESLENC